MVYTACNVPYSDSSTRLLNGNKSAVYADSAYQSEVHSEWLSNRDLKKLFD